MRVHRALAVLIAAAAVVFLCGACAVKFKKIRLEAADKVVPLKGEESAAEQEKLYRRATALYDQLKRSKLTANITKRKLAPYFEQDKQLSEFVAIYATLFRSLNFKREQLQSYKIKKITIVENGVVGLIDVEMKGKIYFIWSAKIHEIQKWEKYEGQWYMIPQIFPTAPPKKPWLKNPWRKTYEEGPVS